jgi:hypothetical protein
MKRQAVLVLDLKQKIQATLKLISLRVKSLVLQLVDLEEQLAQAMKEQLAYSEEQIKSAFNTLSGDRYWKPEMLELIPALVGQGLRSCDPWEHWAKFKPVQRMEALGWKDRVIALVIDAANSLG